MACNTNRVTVALGAGGIIVIVVSALVGWFFFPIILKNKLADILPLKPGSESWERWENPPVDIYFRVYIFHVNNPEEILNGSSPNITEVGPYVYREERTRNVDSYDEENGTVVYEQNMKFEFDQEASGNLTEDDVLTVVNLPALVLSQTVESLKAINPVIKLVNTALDKLWPTPNNNPLFFQAKVKDFLFGKIPMLCNQTTSVENVDTKILCQATRLIRPKQLIIDGIGKGINSFSIFGYKNTSNDGKYVMNLGTKDVTQIGNIISWNNMTEMSFWRGKSCNEISGTDGTIFRPYLDIDWVDSLYVFNGEICRTVKLTHEGYETFKGVTGKRFVADKNVFAGVLNNTENYCFCPQSIKGLTHVGGCLRSGVLDLSSCQGGPAYVSFPHFFMADPFYKKIEGLNPDKEKHQIYLDLEPNTGYPLSAASRIQINTFLKSINEVKIMKKLPNILMPVIWAEEKVELSDDLIDFLNSQLLSTLKIVDIVRWTFIGVGIVMSVGSFVYAIKSANSAKKSSD